MKHFCDLIGCTWEDVACLYQVTSRTLYTWRKQNDLCVERRRMTPKDLLHIFDALGWPPTVTPPPDRQRD
jgi:hypothetical protein